MRKTRLVILPTKCLHQMGFLLLFLSCPVIGDWGRIRPESEDSHNAIQIQRVGTCGLERDPPGGLLKFLDEDGSKQCRLSKDQDSNMPTKATTWSGERRVDVRRTSGERTTQMMERRLMDERRGVQREVRRIVRSRSLDSRRILSGRNDVRSRSLSVGPERERARRSVLTRNTRQYDTANSRRGSERFHSPSRINDRRSEQREQRRLSLDSRREQERASRNERRENERMNRNAAERRERETARLARSQEREREDLRRDSNRRSIQEQSRRRENDMTRRHDEQNERRLSLARREPTGARRDERTENRRSFSRVNLDRRMAEIRKARSLESLGRRSEERENLARRTRDDNRRETESRRRLVTVPNKPLEQSIRERRSGILMERGVKSRRESRPVPSIEADFRKAEDEGLFHTVTKRMDMKSYEGFNTGDWTTNCVIGAVVYFLTTRQIKSV